MDSFHVTAALIEFLRRWGEMSPQAAVVLALVFIAGGLTPVPRLFLSLASGVVFGLSAIPVIIPSSTLGSLLAFLLARYLFAERLRHAIREKPTLVAIMEAVDAEGWRIVALCRLASPIPSTVQNALFGLTQIGVWPYVIATFVFTMPTIVLAVYLGSIGKAALIEDTGSGLNLGLMAAGGLTFLGVAMLVIRRVRERLKAIEQRP
jgi:uncharacterized membrane protein YdjX (TVP38/TMEM64 family)